MLPLLGTHVVELGGMGPVPYAGMLLAELGAQVDLIARPERALHPALDRQKRVTWADLKDSSIHDSLQKMVASADVVIEGFRPGVAERLGFGPEDAARWNPSVIYGRVTGFGREGALADRAGHDINYIGLSGVLGTMGPSGSAPVPPLNLVADFGGGGLPLALGVVAALLRRATTGEGELVDIAMVDGSASLMAMIYGFAATGNWLAQRGGNVLDGGAPYYRTYQCVDGRYVAVGAIEPKFYENLLSILGIDGVLDATRQNDRSYWPAMEAVIAQTFLNNERDEWTSLFIGLDACVTPVLTMDEAPHHELNVERGTFLEIRGGHIPSPSIRLSPLPKDKMG